MKLHLKCGHCSHDNLEFYRKEDGELIPVAECEECEEKQLVIKISGEEK